MERHRGSRRGGGGVGSGGGPCGRPRPIPMTETSSPPAGPRQDTRKGPHTTSSPLPPLRDDVPFKAVSPKKPTSERVVWLGGGDPCGRPWV
ncbi:MAG TPA: hypothetical protein VK140_10110 [Ktedonobacteraceae bacterium]|nr:hypothetical protein [Ktedonobacteraceae bacterium]